MRTRHFAAFGLLCAALLLAGCAQGGSGSAAASDGTGTASPSATASASPSSSAPAPSASSQPSNPPPPAGVALVLTGQVEAGVEPRCLILRDGGQTYQLMGGDPAVVKAGARVRITGHVVDNIMSYCMQGKPFQVTEAHAL
jgi:hypothetical protein